MTKYSSPWPLKLELGDGGQKKSVWSECSQEANPVASLWKPRGSYEPELNTIFKRLLKSGALNAGRIVEAVFVDLERARHRKGVAFQKPFSSTDFFVVERPLWHFEGQTWHNYIAIVEQKTLSAGLFSTVNRQIAIERAKKWIDHCELRDSFGDPLLFDFYGNEI